MISRQVNLPGIFFYSCGNESKLKMKDKREPVKMFHDARYERSFPKRKDNVNKFSPRTDTDLSFENYISAESNHQVLIPERNRRLNRVKGSLKRSSFFDGIKISLINLSS